MAAVLNHNLAGRRSEVLRFQQAVLGARTSVSNHNVAGRLDLNYILAASTESGLGFALRPTEWG